MWRRDWIYNEWSYSEWFWKSFPLLFQNSEPSGDFCSATGWGSGSPFSHLLSLLCQEPIHLMVVCFLDVLILFHDLSSGSDLLCFKTTVKRQLLWLKVIAVSECWYRFRQLKVVQLNVSGDLLSQCVLITGWNYKFINYSRICQLFKKY